MGADLEEILYYRSINSPLKVCKLDDFHETTTYNSCLNEIIIYSNDIQPYPYFTKKNYFFQFCQNIEQRDTVVCTIFVFKMRLPVYLVSPYIYGCFMTFKQLFTCL